MLNKESNIVSFIFVLRNCTFEQKNNIETLMKLMLIQENNHIDIGALKKISENSVPETFV